MARSFIRQATQVAVSRTYSDALTMGASLVSGSASIEGDLNALRTVARHHVYGDNAGAWTDDLATTNSKKRGINALNTALDAVEIKRFLFRREILTTVAVPGSQNYVVLSAAGSTAPSETAAVDGGSALGAVVASLVGAAGSHSLNLVSGLSAIRPKNLCVLADAVTGDAIISGGEEVYGLLQIANGATDGTAFSDVTYRGQLSFVIPNNTRTGLIACPSADIAGKNIHYAYVSRVDFLGMSEQAFLSGAFVDDAATSEITLGTAINNQSGVSTQAQSILWKILNTYALKFQNNSASKDMLAILPNSGNDEIDLNVDTFKVNNVNTALFDKGLIANNAGTKVSVGVVGGEVSSTGAMALRSASGDVILGAALHVNFSDGYKGASTFAGALDLADASADWTNYKAAFGEVSLMNAIYQARNTTTHHKATAAVSVTSIAANTNVTGAGGSPNIDAQLLDYSALDFVTGVNVYVNGQLMRNGPNSGTPRDVYPGTSQANGDLMFTMTLLGTGDIDVITMETF